MTQNVSLAVLTSGNISTLPQEKQEKVLSVKSGLDLSHESIMEFGNEASANLNDFSTAILQEVKMKDVPEIEGLITDLMNNIGTINTETLLNSKPGFFKRLFHVENLNSFIKRYDNVESIIMDIKTKMQSAKIQLEKDVVMLDSFIEQNLQYIDDLDTYILAGTMKKNEALIELKRMQENLDSTDTLAVQEVNRYQNSIERLEKKIYNLTLLRETAVQNIPQIMLIQQGDCVSIDNIQSSIDSAIPLWESQIVIAITLVRQKNVVDLQANVMKTINNMIESNSDRVKSNALSIAKQMEAGIIDIKVLEKSSQNLIETLEGLKQIRIQGAKDRAAAMQKLEQNQLKLSNAIIANASTPTASAITAER